jgi:hypothetical protein
VKENNKKCLKLAPKPHETDTVQNNQKSIGKSKEAHGFLRFQEKPNQTKSFETFVKYLCFLKRKLGLREKNIP